MTDQYEQLSMTGAPVMIRRKHAAFADVHPNFQDQPEVYREFDRGFSPREFAKIHKVHIHTVYRWIAYGLIKAKKIKIYERHRYVISSFATAPICKSGPIPKERSEES